MPTNHVITEANSIEVTDKNGLDMAAGDTLRIDEMGKIVVNGATGFGVNVNGSDTKLAIDGRILTQIGAVQINGDRAQINIGAKGELASTSNIASTIELFGTSASLVINNYGKIASAGMAGAIATNGALNLFNAGLISVAPSILNIAIYGSAEDDVVNNIGTIRGNIQFDAGNNTYYGIGGTVIGQINFGAGNDKAYGGSAAEIFNLGRGNDFVDGGDGQDTLYVADNSPGIVIDLRITGPQNTGLGTKTIINVENIELITSGANKLIGSAVANKFSGADGSDTLEGGGGNDTLDGGLGDDILDGGDGFDIAVFDRNGGGRGVFVDMANPANEQNTEGKDTFISIELLSGTQFADTFMGDAGANGFQGNGGNDTLDGAGGIDTVYYTGAVTANLATGIAVAGGEGTDTLRNIENISGGSGGDMLTGNALVNILYGNSGNDTLNGGKGNDLLVGGAGVDKFVFNTALNSRTNKDKISGWNAKEDTIQLENAIFRKLTKTGALNKASFVLGSAAKDANDFIGYNAKTGDLWYDSNGNGSGGQVVFASIGAKKAISAADFYVI